jgi:HNH endonuclease
MARDIIERFKSKFFVEPWSGCWLWTDHVQSGGYALFYIRGKVGNKEREYAHRFSYKLHKGPIPDGLTLDHKCKTRSCVNPEHLEPVTSAANTLRGRGPTAINAAKTHCSRGHELSGDNLILVRCCRKCRAEASRRHHHTRKRRL